MNLPTLLILSVALAAVSTTRAAELRVGDHAPSVVGTTEEGNKLSFGEFYAKQEYTLVYFYPKADTPGCTAQGCSLRDAYEELQNKGVAVLGVSLDNTMDNKAFKEKYGLPFTLISDTEKTVVNAFGVPATRVAQREAFLIKDGVIVWADYSAATDKQAEDVLAVLAEREGKKS